jgi:sigma-B regulation protein RsbU (phosphoserine phosphatase)
VLDLVNRALVRTGDRRAFMTLCFGVLDPTTGAFDFALAGHPYPILRRVSGEVAELGRGSLPLGIRGTVDPFTDRVTLEQGDLLAIVTDGFPEALDGEGRSFGFERTRAAVAAGGGPAAVHERLVAEVERFAGDRPADDDRSVLIVSRVPMLPSRPPAPP